MRTLRLLTVTAMVAAALVLAPAAYAQTTPTVSVMASQPITEGDVAVFMLMISEPVTTGDIDVAYYLEETERVGEHVNSNLVPDGSEGGGIAIIPRAGYSTDVVVWTRADGVHEDSRARNGRTNPLTLTIRPGPDYQVGTPSSATVQVGDDEAGWGTLAWESTDVTVTEGDGHVDLALTLSKPYSYPLTLPSLAFVDSADAGDDFDIADITGGVVIPPRSRRIPLRIGIVDDDQPEYAESFGVRVDPDGLPVNAGDLVATVRIADDDEESREDTDEPTVPVPAGPAEPDSQEPQDESAVESCAIWCVEWSASTLAEGESVTLAVRNPAGAVADGEQVAVTLHIGRSEGTADVDDIEVRVQAPPDEILLVHTFHPNKHRQGGWVYIYGFVPVEQPTVRTITVEAVDNLDGVNSETLATWVYVNGDLAGAQVLTITSGPQTQQ